MKTLFTRSERQALKEEAAGVPRAIDIMGQAKGLDYKGATIGRIPNAYVVYAITNDGEKTEVARYYFQDDKARAKRHAKWDAESTLRSLKKTLGLAESSPLPHMDVVMAVKKAYSETTSGEVTTKDIAAAAGLPVSKMASKLKAAEKAGVVKSRVIKVRSRSQRASGTTHKRQVWWMPRHVRQQYGVSAFKEESSLSVEDALRAVYDTGINDHIGYAFTKDIAKRYGVSVAALNKVLSAAERKGLVKGYTMRTRITGGRRPSGTPIKMKHWRLTKEGQKHIGIKSVLDD